jgi:DNA-directed RNA polymerase specialized sigma24 family protein
MNQQQRKALFRQMVNGDSEATRQLAEYLRLRGPQAAAGDAVARDELETLVYDITYDYVKKRLRRDFHFLRDRHSAASVVHEAWLRLLGPSPPPIEDPLSLCRRIAHMVRYALLDIVRAQRDWDGRHHAPPGPAGADKNPPAFDIVKARANGISVVHVPRSQAGPDKNAPALNLGRAEDPQSPDPARLAVWSEFHERVASLPEDVREVFELDCYVEMSRGAIAKQLGVTEHCVRRLKLDALRRLGDVVPGQS